MMDGPRTSTSAEPGSRPRRAGRVILLGGALLLACALSVPFVYETQTLWYKAGAHRIMLRSGQMAGLLALVLLMGQILLSLRLPQLERVYGGARLLRWHRGNGLVVACAATGHVLLVQAPEGFANIGIGIKYWPEMVGGALFSLLLLTVLLARLRTVLHLDYARWKRLHGWLGYLLPGLALIHVLFVSESFAQGLPRTALVLLFAGLALTAAAARGRQMVRKGSSSSFTPHQYKEKT